MLTKLFTIAFFIMMMIGCTSVKYLKTEQIPDGSKWIGGKDGGSWIFVQLKDSNQVRIDVYEVYHDQTSELLGSFDYDVICKEQKVNNKKVLNAILFSDGLNIEWDNRKKIVKCLKRK